MLDLRFHRHTGWRKLGTGGWATLNWPVWFPPEMWPPGHRTPLPPPHVTQKQEKETRQENYRTWVSKIKPISNIKPGEIHHWSQKQLNAFHAKYLKAPALLQSSFSSCAFESEQKIQLNGCKSRDPSIKLLRNYFFQVRELLLNAEWE